MGQSWDAPKELFVSNQIQVLKIDYLLKLNTNMSTKNSNTLLMFGRTSNLKKTIRLQCPHAFK